jgi:protein SCO1
MVALFGCHNRPPQLPYYNQPDFTPVFFSSHHEAEKQVQHTIDTFHFTNQFGQPVSLNQVAGKIHVANFFFTACGSICPPMMNNLKRVNQRFGADTGVAILSFSVTPWLDSVPRLKKYYDHSMPDAANWHLLTGSKGRIYELARRSYFAEQDLGYTKDSTEFLHTEHFLLVDKTGRLRGIYNGTLQLEAEQLIKDIELLKQEN